MNDLSLLWNNDFIVFVMFHYNRHMSPLGSRNDILSHKKPRHAETFATGIRILSRHATQTNAASSFLLHSHYVVGIQYRCSLRLQVIYIPHKLCSLQQQT